MAYSQPKFPLTIILVYVIVYYVCRYMNINNNDGGLSLPIYKHRTISYSQRFLGCLTRRRRIAQIPIVSENGLSHLKRKDRHMPDSQRKSILTYISVYISIENIYTSIFTIIQKWPFLRCFRGFCLT